MIELRSLSKTYGKKQALSDFSMDLEQGKVIGLVGPNGAGKTTAFRIIAGLLRPDSGTILIDGEDFTFRRKDMIGYMPDFFGIYDKLKVNEYMAFFADIYGLGREETASRTDELLELVGLSDEKASYVDTLSRGMKQKLCLARCLIHDPRLLILDEPASGLDPRSRFEFKQIIRKLSGGERTIIISSHILADLSEICSDICILDEGRIVLQGSIEDIEYQILNNQRIEIKTAAGYEKALTILREDPLVDNLTYTGQTISVSFDGNTYEAADLLNRLVKAGVPVCSFSRSADNLESLFMQITKPEVDDHGI